MAALRLYFNSHIKYYKIILPQLKYDALCDQSQYNLIADQCFIL